MTKFITAFCAALLLAMPQATFAKTNQPDNRAIVDAFLDLLIVQGDVKRAFETYVAPDYVQHHPDIADGRDAAIAALSTGMFGVSAQIKRVLVDGDLAVVHLHARKGPDDPGLAIMDMFRLEGGKIVEHWDVMQPVPVSSVNPHPMF